MYIRFYFKTKKARTLSNIAFIKKESGVIQAFFINNIEGSHPLHSGGREQLLLQIF